MPHPPEPKVSAGQPNIQDVFLNYTRRERLAVSIQLMTGETLEGSHQELRSLRRDRRD